MLLLLLGMPHRFIWDRQHTNPRRYSSPHSHLVMKTNRAWSSWPQAERWSFHLHPCTLITSHRSAAQNCQHLIPYISRSLEWVRFLMRNLGQNDWFCALVWKKYNNVGGSRLWLSDYNSPEHLLIHVFLSFLPESKALSLRAPHGPQVTQGCALAQDLELLII